MAESAEHIQKQVRIYLSVFAVLMVLTVVTVAISYLHLSTGKAIALALVVASIKASLVALYFMHLVSEKKIVYAILSLTAFFFLILLLIPNLQ